MGLFDSVTEGDIVERERGSYDKYEVTRVQETFGDRVSIETVPVRDDNNVSSKFMEPEFEREFAPANNTPDPFEIHESRSEYAQKQDEARDARITTDVEKWANDPDSWDFPGVDTGPTFRREQGEDFDTESFLDRFFNF